jgi:hypothetical protein
MRGRKSRRRGRRRRKKRKGLCHPKPDPSSPFGTNPPRQNAGLMRQTMTLY